MPGRKGYRRYNREQVLAAIKGSRGIVSVVAQRLGCQWNTARKYIDMWAETRRAFQDERETLLDIAESTLVHAMVEGEPPVAVGTAKWVLARLGKERGWGDAVNVTTGGQPIMVIFRWVRPDGSDIGDD